MIRHDVEGLLRSLGWVLASEPARKEGSYRAAVMAFQEMWTYEPLAIDGIPGERTQAAMRQCIARGGLVSAHFRPSEFRCACKGQRVGCATQRATRQLIAGLEDIRARYYPTGLTVVSGYRCPSYNDSLKYSIKTSRHLHGQAADIPRRIHYSKMTSAHLTGLGYKRSTGQVIHVEHGRYATRTTFVDQP